MYSKRFWPYTYLQLQSLLCCPPQQNLFNKLPLFTVSNSSSPTPAWPSAHHVTDTTLAKVSNSLDGVRFNELLGVLPLSDPSAAFAGWPLSFLKISSSLVFCFLTYLTSLSSPWTHHGSFLPFPQTCTRWRVKGSVLAPLLISTLSL